MRYSFFLLATLFILGITANTALSQCDQLRPQRDISFNTDQDCAPVTVTQFAVTYYFNTPQDPNDIIILYEWNDPGSNITFVDVGSGLVSGGGGTSFTANATFTYFDNNGQCTIRPTTSILIGGVLCPSSTQMQTAFFWGTDEQANGVVQMDPTDWEVCFDNPVTNAVFTDASDFNCNIVVEPDNPNRFSRSVQFVYGTNHNPAATIRNLSLNDGAVQPLTDGTGNLASTSTRGTGAVMVTGAYFGPVETIPYPADAPVSMTFPMNAPADINNLVGNRFEITLFNWNVCNPYNGDPVNPNYEDAVITTGYIVIVDAPAPAFITRDNNGVNTKDFCIGENINFVNQTPGAAGLGFTWEFFDDATGSVLLDTRTSTNPNYSFATGGSKLVRLTASNPTAQGSCIEIYEDVINITPALVAEISLTDLSNNPISGDFCQEAVAPFTTFDARFSDISAGTVSGSTRWRWEFYDENNNLVRQEPNGGGFSSTLLGPFDEVFINPGVYRVRLIIADNVTGCQTEDEVQVRVLNKPAPDFTFDTVCEDDPTTFTDNTSLTAINGQTITSREWDMDYDGITFNANAAYADQTNFTHQYPAPGTYDVALRVMANPGGCSEMIVHSVTVNPKPNSSFTPDVTSGCSVLTVTFTNNAIGGQPDVVDQYIWEINGGMGFQVDSIQRPTDPGFTGEYIRDFENFGTVNKVFQVRLRTVTQNGCFRLAPPQNITVFPGPRSGYLSTNYSPFNQNCTPVAVDFVADNQTQSLNPSSYRWIVSDAGGVLVDQNTGTTPTFSYQFINNTQSIRDYTVTLRTTLSTGCSRDSLKTIRINPVPVSTFTVDTLLFDCQEMQMRFEADQKGLSEYAWTVIVNGVTMFTQVSTDDFLNYNFVRGVVQQDVEIQLQTTNFASCLGSPESEFFSVPVDNNIVVSFTATPPTHTWPNATVTITNNTTPGGLQYLWDFGDGTTSTSPTPGSHTYATWGTFPITVTVMDGSCQKSQTTSVTIMPVPPTIDFTYDPAAGCSPLTVQFTNISINADPTSFVWDFGPGEVPSTAINPVHTFVTPGLYTVTLTASDNAGGTISVTKTDIIEVFESPTAQFNIKPTEVSIPGDVYTDNRSFGATSFLWDFGDGETSTLFEPIHRYESAGIFDIVLVAYNSTGCSDTARIESAVAAIEGAQILLPNAFSPGRNGPGTGDGKNDTFLPLMRGDVQSFQMQVFNRWGELLFESRSRDLGWDGYYKGKLCQQDVYVYKIVVTFADSDTITKIGDIHLIR